MHTVSTAESLRTVTAASLEERLAAFRASHQPKHLDVAGTRWTYYAAGQGDRCLVVLPGAIGGGEGFFVLIQELESECRIIAAEIPLLPRIEDFTRGLIATLDTEGIPKATFLGASFSGVLCQALVRRHPERVANLILSHTAVPAPEQAKVNRRALKIARLLPVGAVRALFRLLLWLLLKKIPERKFWLSFFGEIRAMTPDFLVSRYEASIDLAENYRWTPQDLAGWEGRVLIIRSDDDRMVTRRSNERLLVLYPGAHVHTFSGTGHGSYVADPLAYTAVVRSFLRSA